MGSDDLSGRLSKQEETRFDSSLKLESQKRHIISLIRSKMEIHELDVLIFFADPVAIN